MQSTLDRLFAEHNSGHYPQRAFHGWKGNLQIRYQNLLVKPLAPMSCDQWCQLGAEHIGVI